MKSLPLEGGILDNRNNRSIIKHSFYFYLFIILKYKFIYFNWRLISLQFCIGFETGAYYTEWSKPERKTPIHYTNAYVWNLERW